MFFFFFNNLNTNYMWLKTELYILDLRVHFLGHSMDCWKDMNGYKLIDNKQPLMLPTTWSLFDLTSEEKWAEKDRNIHSNLYQKLRFRS